MSINLSMEAKTSDNAGEKVSQENICIYIDSDPDEGRVFEIRTEEQILRINAYQFEKAISFLFKDMRE